MADRKGRSITFKTPIRVALGRLKAAIEEEIEGAIIVFQDLGNGEYLVECERKEDAEVLVEQGFDVEEIHVGVHPPKGKYVNVSIMGLRSYIEDEEVKEALSQYGDIKSQVIRLKYKTDHELAGLENGNRLVKMVLDKKSIPYSIRISGEWCRIIHNDQEPVCTECSEIGHLRKNCPLIKCRICNNLGHISYNCENKAIAEQKPDGENTSIGENNADMSAERSESKNLGDNNQDLQGNTEQGSSLQMEIEQKGLKRQHHTDSDSDGKAPSRRQRIAPAPNIDTARKREQRSVRAAEDPDGKVQNSQLQSPQPIYP